MMSLLYLRWNRHPFSNINISNKRMKNTIEACHEVKERFKRIMKKMSVFKRALGEIDPLTFNVYIKAKLRESVSRKLAIKRWVKVYTLPEEDAVMEIEEHADSRQLYEAFKTVNVNYYNIKKRTKWRTDDRGETRENSWRNSRRTHTIQESRRLYIREKW